METNNASIQRLNNQLNTDKCMARFPYDRCNLSIAAVQFFQRSLSSYGNQGYAATTCTSVSLQEACF